MTGVRPLTTLNIYVKIKRMSSDELSGHSETLGELKLPPLPVSVSLDFQNGVLPPGDYPMTFDDIRRSILVRGPVVFRAPTWDSTWRGHLVDNLEVLVNQLWVAGVENIYIDGSFVEEKDHPNDIDGYFECDPADFRGLANRLNQLDPHKCWIWDPNSRQLHKGSTKRQLPMWCDQAMLVRKERAGDSS